jgi:hypothetical protein
MGDRASFVLRRASAGPVERAHSHSPGIRGWMCWNLAPTSHEELAELAGPGAVLLVSESGGGSAAIAGRYGGDTAWTWEYGREEPSPERVGEAARAIQEWTREAGLDEPDARALVNTLFARNERAMESVHDLLVVVGVWEPV